MPNEERPARQISDYLEILRRRWRLVALVASLTIGMAAAYSINQETVYRSSMKIVVGQGQGIFSAEFGNAAEEFTQTMSDLLESQVVAQTVIERLDIDTTPSKLLSNLRVVTKPSTSVLEVSYDDTDRARGREILTEVGDVFTELVDERLAQAAQPADGAVAVSATVFDPAHFVPGQVRPTPLRTLAIALVLGSLLGLVTALVREQFDDTIRSIEGAERAFGQPVTATLPPHFLGYSPIARRPARGKLKTRLDPVLAELMVQKMRSEVMWPLDPGAHRTVVVTSAHQEEGKTTVAANLAVAIAKQGHDVIVVDADLRRPLLHTYLGVPVGPSTVDLEAVLRGNANLQRALLEISLLTPAGTDRSRGLRPIQAATKSTTTPKRPPGRLRALLAAPDRPTTSEFQIEVASQLVERLHEQGNIVIIDTPPILTVTDAYAMIAVADTVVAAIRNGRSSASAATAFYRTLSRLRSKRGDSIKLVVTEIEPQFDVAYGYFTPESPRAVSSSTTPSGLVRVENLPPSPPTGS